LVSGAELDWAEVLLSTAGFDWPEDSSAGVRSPGCDGELATGREATEACTFDADTGPHGRRRTAVACTTSHRPEQDASCNRSDQNAFARTPGSAFLYALLLLNGKFLVERRRRQLGNVLFCQALRGSFFILRLFARRLAFSLSISSWWRKARRRCERELEPRWNFQLFVGERRFSGRGSSFAALRPRFRRVNLGRFQDFCGALHRFFLYDDGRRMRNLHCSRGRRRSCARKQHARKLFLEASRMLLEASVSGAAEGGAGVEARPRRSRFGFEERADSKQTSSLERPGSWPAQEWKPALPTRAANQRAQIRAQRVSRARDSPKIAVRRTPAQQAQPGRQAEAA